MRNLQWAGQRQALSSSDSIVLFDLLYPPSLVNIGKGPERSSPKTYTCQSIKEKKVCAVLTSSTPMYSINVANPWPRPSSHHPGERRSPRHCCANAKATACATCSWSLTLEISGWKSRWSSLCGKGSVGCGFMFRTSNLVLIYLDFFYWFCVLVFRHT